MNRWNKRCISSVWMVLMVELVQSTTSTSTMSTITTTSSISSTAHTTTTGSTAALTAYFVLPAVPEENVNMQISTTSVDAVVDLMYPRFDVYAPAGGLGMDVTRICAKLVQYDTRSTTCAQVTAGMGKPCDGIPGQVAWIDGVRNVWEGVKFPEGRWKLCYSDDGGQDWRVLGPSISAGPVLAPPTDDTTTLVTGIIAATATTETPATSATAAAATTTTTILATTTTTSTATPARTAARPGGPTTTTTTATTTPRILKKIAPITTTTTSGTQQSPGLMMNTSTTSSSGTLQNTSRVPVASPTSPGPVPVANLSTSTHASPGDGDVSKSGMPRIVGEVRFSLNFSTTDVQDSELQVTRQSSRMWASLRAGLARFLDVAEQMVTILSLAVGPGRRLLLPRRLGTIGKFLIQYEAVVIDAKAAKAVADMAAGEALNTTRFAEVVIMEGLVQELTEELNEARYPDGTLPVQLNATDLTALRRTAESTLSATAIVDDPAAGSKIDFSRETARFQMSTQGPTNSAEQSESGDGASIAAGVICGFLAICSLVYLFLRYRQRRKSMPVHADETEQEPEDKAVKRPQKQTQPEQGRTREPALPPGWVSVIAQDTGETYFYNSATGVSQWEIPQDLPEQSDDAPRKMTMTEAIKLASEECSDGSRTSAKEASSRFALPKAVHVKSATQQPLRVAAQTVSDHPAAQTSVCSAKNPAKGSRRLSNEVVGSSHEPSADDGLNRLSFDQLLIYMNGRGLDATDCMSKQDMLRKIRNAGNLSSTVANGVPIASPASTNWRATPGRAKVDRQIKVQRGFGQIPHQAPRIPRQTSWRAGRVTVEE